MKKKTFCLLGVRTWLFGQNNIHIHVYIFFIIIRYFNLYILSDWPRKSLYIYFKYGSKFWTFRNLYCLRVVCSLKSPDFLQRHSIIHSQFKWTSTCTSISYRGHYTAIIASQASAKDLFKNRQDQNSQHNTVYTLI